MANLKSVVLWESGVFVATPTGGHAEWRWPAPEQDLPANSPTYHFVGLNVWMGVAIGGICDFGVQIRRRSDWNLMAMRGWDHYQDPTATSEQLIWYPSPHTMDIGPGDSIIFWAGASGDNPWPKGNCGVVVVGYYYN